MSWAIVPPWRTCTRQGLSQQQVVFDLDLVIGKLAGGFSRHLSSLCLLVMHSDYCVCLSSHALQFLLFRQSSARPCCKPL